MNAFDAEFLHLEDGVNHMHIGVCAVFEGPSPDEDEARALVTAAVDRIPRYRQRLRRAPLDLARPRWEDATDYDLSDHLFRCDLPGPGDDEQLQELSAEIMSTELDRRRPLWELWVVDGLTDGRWALVAKSHHCMVDGIAGVDLLTVLLSVDPEAEPATWTPTPPVSETRLAATAVAELARPVLAAPGWVATRVRHPTRAAHDLRTLASGARAWAGVLWPTSATSIDGSVGTERAWAWARIDLADVKAVRAERGGTVNDVVLSAVTRGLRDLLVARGEDPPAALRTVIPVSVRTDVGAVDNEVSAVIAELPLSIVQPELRLVAVIGETERLKASHEIEVGEAATGLADWLPPPLLAAGTRAAAALLRHHPQHQIGTVVTNVPGPQVPLHAAGRRMLAVHPFVGVGFGVRITVAVLSYDGHLFFGITGDKASTPDLGVVARGVEAEVADLLARAG